MYSASDRLRGAKTLIGWGAALLTLAVVVSTAAADPVEVLVYQFDPSVDSTTTIGGLKDHSPNGFNGTCTSLFSYPGAMKIVPGHLAGTFALATAGLDEFPGTYVWTGATAGQLGLNPSPTATGSFTMMAWVYRNNLRHGDQMIFGTTGDRDVGFALHLGFRNYDTWFGTWNGDSSAILAPTPLAGAWHHMVWRYNAATKTQDIFIDGVNMNSQGGQVPFEQGDQAFLIGGAFPGAQGDNAAFAGLIEYPRVFNLALSDGQIKNAAKDQPIGP